MNVIYLIGGIQALYLALTIVLRKGKPLHVWLLLAIFLNSAALLLSNYVESFSPDEASGLLPFTFFSFLAPLMHWHFRSLFHKSFVKTDLLHLLSAIIPLFLYLLLETSDLSFYVLFGTLGLYAVYALSRGSRYLKSVENTFTDADNYTRNWIFCLSGSLLMVAICGLFPLIVPVESWTWASDAMFYSMFLTLSMFFVGYLALIKRDDILVQHNVKKPMIITEEPTLNVFMQDKKPYLDNDLNIHKLAESMEMTSTHLSELIKQQSGKNFSQFVNSFRVEEVKMRLQNGAASEFTLLGIAFDCGFNSKASFNRVFKESTGMTPREYQKSLG